MKNIRTYITAVLALCLVLVTGSLCLAGPGYYSEPQDSSEIIRVKYSPSAATYSATLTVADNLITIAGDDVSSGGAIDVTSATVSELCASINAITNTSGTYCFQAFPWAAIGTETVAANLVAASADTLSHDTWEYHGKWDTSDVKHFDVVPSTVFSPNEIVNSFKVIDRIVGEPGGTGDLTLAIYEGTTLVWQETYTSPYYVLDGGVSSQTATNQAVNTVTLECDIGIPAKQGTKYLIRATRATTGTTGVLGVITDQ